MLVPLRVSPWLPAGRRPVELGDRARLSRELKAVASARFWSHWSDSAAKQNKTKTSSVDKQGPKTHDGVRPRCRAEGGGRAAWSKGQPAAAWSFPGAG